MGAADTLKLRRPGLEEPATNVVGLQGPVRHPIGHRHDRQRVSGRKIVVGVGALERVDVGKKLHNQQKL